jgi:hypothetical protein
MVGGEVALRMRLAALTLVERFKLYEVVPQASDSLRFKFHAGLAAMMYALRTGKNGPESLAAISATATRMEQRFVHHYMEADESGLLSEMESGESLSLRATTIFGTMSGSEVVKMRDILRENDKGRCTAGQMLTARHRIDDSVHNIRQLLANLMGFTPRANDRALAQAFDRDLRRHMPTVKSSWPLPELLGIDGWALQRATDAGATPRYRLICTSPSSPHFTKIVD